MDFLWTSTNDPQVIDVVSDELRGMLHRETGYRIDNTSFHEMSIQNGLNHLDSTSHNQDELQESGKSERYRHTLIRWLVEVVDYFEMDKQIVAWTMNYFDRYLVKVPGTHGDASKIRLLMMACLGVSVKVRMMQGGFLSPARLISLTRGDFTVDDVVGMELELLAKLEWHVHPPTTHDFLVGYLTLMKDDYPAQVLCSLFEQTSTIADHVLQNGQPSLRNYLPSVLSVAILFYFMEGDITCHLVRGSKNPLPELHRRGIFVNALDSMRCLQELVNFLEPSDDPTAVPQGPVEEKEAMEEKEATDDGRMASPVANSLS